MGKQLWSYDCGLAPVDAETSRYYFGLWAWKAGVKGCAIWAYADVANPAGIRDWNYIASHLDNMELTYSFVYPAPDGPIPSLAWEAIREGIDDHKYLSTLAKLIEKAKSAGRKQPAQRAERILNEITDKIHVESYQAATKVGTATGRRLGGHYDRPSPEPGISKNDYNRLRYKIAQQIIKLENATRTDPSL